MKLSSYPGEAVQLEILTGPFLLGVSRFLRNPTFPTFPSRDVEGGLGRCR